MALEGASAMRQQKRPGIGSGNGMAATMEASPGAAEETINKRKEKHNGKQYDKEFKVAAAKLVTEQGYTPKRAATSLGVPVNTLQYWIKVFAHRPRQEAETLETLRLRNRQLEAQVQQLTLEREI
jgi:transposase-like protein